MCSAETVEVLGHKLTGEPTFFSSKLEPSRHLTICWLLTLIRVAVWENKQFFSIIRTENYYEMIQ